MAMTYDYETRKITRDWYLKRDGEKCRLSGLPAKVGGERCRKCPYHKGETFDMDAIEYEDSFLTYCSHPQATDSENTEKLLGHIYRRFENEAISHMYD